MKPLPVKEIHLPGIFSFDWNEGNSTKSQLRHQVLPVESEQVFFDDPVYFYDEKHSQKEDRYFAYGLTDQKRKLCVVFTIRENRIRVISSRNQNKKERKIYEQSENNS